MQLVNIKPANYHTHSKTQNYGNKITTIKIEM